MQYLRLYPAAVLFFSMLGAPSHTSGLDASSDPCVQLNSAIAALPASGGILDETNISGNQTCNVTLRITVPVTITFGYANWTFNGNPGISIASSAQSSLVGAAHVYAYDPTNPQGTVFTSGVAAPLIVDAGSGGSQFSNLDLDGNGIGTFGFLGALAGGMVWTSVHVHSFQYAGVIALGGVNTFHDLMSNNNGGDGIVFANDAVVDGNGQIALNGGVGVHTLLSGTRITDLDSDHNTLHGIYFDGRARPDWTRRQLYVVPTLIKPLHGNPGGYYFLSVNVGGSAGNSAPIWTQSTHALISDGTVKWLNVGTFHYLPPTGMIGNSIIGGMVDDNGNGEPPGFVSDNIRIEGASPTDYSAKWNHIDGTKVQQAQLTAYPVTGIHLLYSLDSAISNVSFLGGDWGDVNSGDAGGYVIESSYTILINASNSSFSARNAIKIINSSYAMVQGFQASQTGVSHSLRADTYCISVDSHSSHTSLAQIDCDSNNAYGRGIYNGGTDTTIQGYVNSTTAVPADQLGTVSSLIDAKGNGTLHSVQAPTGSIGNLSASRLAVQGAGTFNSISAPTASVNALQASSIAVQGQGTFHSLNTTTASIGTLQASNVSVGGGGTFGTLGATNATITNLQASHLSVGGAGTFGSLTAPVLSTGNVQTSRLALTEGGSFFTNGRLIPAGSCESHSVSIPGVMPNSRISWSIGGGVGVNWAFVTVQPHAQTNAVVMAICNPTNRAVVPARSSIYVTVIH